jgi:hypothetical protein
VNDREFARLGGHIAMWETRREQLAASSTTTPAGPAQSATKPMQPPTVQPPSPLAQRAQASLTDWDKLFERSKATLERAGIKTAPPMFIGTTGESAVAVNKAAAAIAPINFPWVPKPITVPGPVATANAELAALRFQKAQDHWFNTFRSSPPPVLEPPRPHLDLSILDSPPQQPADLPPYVLPPGGELLTAPNPFKAAKAIQTAAGWVVKVGTKVWPVARAGYYVYKGVSWIEDNIEPGPTPPLRTKYEPHTSQLLYEWPGGQWSTEPPP